MENVKIRLLTKDEIEVKIKKLIKTDKTEGAIALLYKTSRVDMAILDETFGAQNWTDDYKDIKGNLYCGIGVRSSENAEFVWKWDCGIESREDEGNQKKGEASDAFKRAGFKWGIGRELYSAPFIFLSVGVKDSSGKLTLEDQRQTFEVSKIEYNETTHTIESVTITDNKGNVVFPSRGASPKKTPPAETPTATPLPPLTSSDISSAKALTKKQVAEKAISEFHKGNINYQVNIVNLLSALNIFKDDKYCNASAEIVKKYAASGKAVDLTENGFYSVVAEICELAGA